MGKELTIYEKALGAIILQQAGKVAEAKLFMQSLMEFLCFIAGLYAVF